jgi:hypothetical protein
MKENLWVSLAYFLAHLLLVVAVVLTLTTSVFVISSHKATGTIVQAYRAPQHRVTHLSVQFPLGDSKVQFSQEVMYYFPKSGESVSVLYDPNNPARAKIDRFWNLWNEVVICALLALFCYVAAIAAEQRNEQPRAPTARFLIFNDLRARVIAFAVVALIVLFRSCSQ